jgi:hypothetical protein
MGCGTEFWLHPSPNEIKRLSGICQTKTKLIREEDFGKPIIKKDGKIILETKV